MQPANDNTDRAHHAAIVLRHVLGAKPDPRFEAGLAYARAANPAEMDATLAIAGFQDTARRLLRDGEDLTTAGMAIGEYKTETQARAAAREQLKCALKLLLWHPQRVERDRYSARLIERINILKAQNEVLVRKVS